MNRVLLCALLMIGVPISAQAEIYSVWVAWSRALTKHQGETYARLVFEESDRAGIQRPVIDVSSHNGSTDIARVYPLINADTGEEADGWGIKLNVGMIIDFHEPRLRYMARWAVCFRQRELVAWSTDLRHSHVWHGLARCTYLKYDDEDVHEYLALFRVDQGPFVAAAGLTIDADDTVLREYFRMLYGDRPHQHWSGR